MIVALTLAGPLRAQQSCQPPPTVTNLPGANIFTPDEEIALGDALAEQITKGNLRISEDPAIVHELQRISDRLASNLPPNQLKFQYFLVDLPTPNAFSLAGGRIYISRKLVAFVRSEDEMAGIIAHEMGHIVTHQGALDYTHLFARVLGVTSLKDRQDVFDRFNQLEDNWRRNPEAFRAATKETEANQLMADQVALYALARAGYSLQSFADIFNRISESGGKTGNWLSDFFHNTPPEQRRLKDIVKTVQTMPAARIQQASPSPPGEFKSWQAAVIQFENWGPRATLQGILTKVHLDPPLRGQINHIRFSPDGKYLLAQDPNKIYVMTVNPLALLFDFEAPDAVVPEFRADSKAVVFRTETLHVESWDLATKSRTATYEPTVPKGCADSLLAADGKTLACFTNDSALILMDVTSGNELLRKNSFATLLQIRGYNLRAFAFKMAFSPDGRSFLAVTTRRALGFDISSRQELHLGGVLADGNFDNPVFPEPDRVMVRDPQKPSTVLILAFPSGKQLGRIALQNVPFATSTHGDYVYFVPKRQGSSTSRSIGEPPGAAVVDPRTNQVIFELKRKSVVDLYDDLLATELRDGTIALYQASTKTPVSRVDLPGSDLGPVHMAAASPDLKWLALAEHYRGGVWNLQDGSRLYLASPFDGAWFAPDGYLYAEFPKDADDPRSMARLNLDHPEIIALAPISDLLWSQHGGYLSVLKPAHDESPYFNVVRELHDIRTGQVVWKRSFPSEDPSMNIDFSFGTAVLYWPASAKAVDDEGKHFPSMGRAIAADKDRKLDYFLEVIHLPDGKPLGAMLVDTGKGSFKIERAFAVGDRVVLRNSLSQVLVYSLSSGEKKGGLTAIGQPVASDAGNLLAVLTQREQLTLYDLNSMNATNRYSFTSPVVEYRFSQDGKRLLVVTADQTAYIFDSSAGTNN
jgi:WD40 repeat protein